MLNNAFVFCSVSTNFWNMALLSRCVYFCEDLFGTGCVDICCLLTLLDCSSTFDQGNFCETYHSDAAGWRKCESCGKVSSLVAAWDLLVGVHSSIVLFFNADI